MLIQQWFISWNRYSVLSHIQMHVVEIETAIDFKTQKILIVLQQDHFWLHLSSDDFLEYSSLQSDIEKADHWSWQFLFKIQNRSSIVCEYDF